MLDDALGNGNLFLRKSGVVLEFLEELVVLFLVSTFEKDPDCGISGQNAFHQFATGRRIQNGLYVFLGERSTPKG